MSETRTALEQALYLFRDEHRAFMGHDVHHPGCKYCEAMAALRSAPPAPAPTWQSIESAPKDGTRVVIVGPHGAILIALWKDEAAFERCERRPGWEVDDCEDCWYSFSLEPSGPTHWMPLPLSPSLPSTPKEA